MEASHAIDDCWLQDSDYNTSKKILEGYIGCNFSLLQTPKTFCKGKTMVMYVRSILYARKELKLYIYEFLLIINTGDLYMRAKFQINRLGSMWP